MGTLQITLITKFMKEIVDNCRTHLRTAGHNTVSDGSELLKSADNIFPGHATG